MAYPSSFLTDLFTRIRDYTDEPEDSAKWTDAKLYRWVRQAFHRVMQDVNAVGDNPIVVRWDLDVNAEDQVYYLPPNVGQILRFGRVNDQNQLVYDAVVPRSRLNPVGAGIIFEGPRVRLEPRWNTGETLRVEYIPNGDCPMHEGVVDQTEIGADTLKLDITPSAGEFDQRPNAYLGSCVRLLDGPVPSGHGWFPVQDRVIVSQSTSSGDPNWWVYPDVDFDPPPVETGNYTYEIVPFFGWMFIEALAWNVAMSIHATNMSDPARAGKLKAAQLMYNNEMRAIRGSLSHYNARSGGKFDGDMPGNSRYSWSLGIY